MQNINIKLGAREGSIINDVLKFITAKGSEYTRLSDNRFRRFKKADGRTYEPYSVTAFLPDYNTLQRIFPVVVRDGRLGTSENDYADILTGFVYRNEISVPIVDQNGNKINDVSQFHSVGGQAYLCLRREGDNPIFLPASRIPRLNWMPFESTLIQRDGKREREQHLGNKVVEIIYSNCESIRL